MDGSLEETAVRDFQKRCTPLVEIVWRAPLDWNEWLTAQTPQMRRSGQT